MIVVVGRLEPVRAQGTVSAGGPVATIARAAAAAGATVQCVARVPDDQTGDAMLLSLAASGVQHVATIRDPSANDRLEGDDLALALRYLGDIGVLVLTASDDPGVVAAAAAAAEWHSGALIVVTHEGASVPEAIPPHATVIEAPRSDPDGAFAALLGAYAAALDAGADPGTAFRSTIESTRAWTTVGD